MQHNRIITALSLLQGAFPVFECLWGQKKSRRCNFLGGSVPRLKLWLSIQIFKGVFKLGHSFSYKPMHATGSASLWQTHSVEKILFVILKNSFKSTYFRIIGWTFNCKRQRKVIVKCNNCWHQCSRIYFIF